MIDFADVQVRAYVEENISLCEPDSIHICDGSEAENSILLRLMLRQGTIRPLPKYDNWWVWDVSVSREDTGRNKDAL